MTVWIVALVSFAVIVVAGVVLIQVSRRRASTIGPAQGSAPPRDLGARPTSARGVGLATRIRSLFGSGASGDDAQVELTYNWDQKEPYPTGRFFGHLAYQVDDIYETCARLKDAGVVIHRPPRDGYMAFIKSPDGHSVELLQKGDALPKKEPWASMPNTGEW